MLTEEPALRCTVQNASSLALQGPLCRGALAALFSLAPSKLEEALDASMHGRKWTGESPPIGQHFFAYEPAFQPWWALEAR